MRERKKHVCLASGTVMMVGEETRGPVRVHTSSSISEMSARRYSSMVRWKASRSLRFTGTVVTVVSLAMDRNMDSGSAPFMIVPTSSIVNSWPASPFPKPPSHAQSRVE